jgi:hypothetical protein
VDVADAQPARSLAEAEELVVDEDILDVVELVDVLHNCLTLILYKGLDKSISADGNTKANVAVNHKRRGREQGNELREGGIGIEHALCCSVRISCRGTLEENLGLVEIEVEASVLLEVVGLAPATLEFWVRFPNERNQGKQGATLCSSSGFLTGPSVH